MDASAGARFEYTRDEFPQASTMTHDNLGSSQRYRPPPTPRGPEQTPGAATASGQ